MSNPVLLDSETVAGLMAALFNVTVHVVDALLPRVEGAQAMEVSWAGALAVKVKVCEEPFSELVNRAV
ncbi:MAG: hypothetical protein M3O20_00265 [Acidobacteriota bacterium]|nr:hypothetical protein [Acidobacteriota bacterium]